MEGLGRRIYMIGGNIGIAAALMAGFVTSKVAPRRRRSGGIKWLKGSGNSEPVPGGGQSERARRRRRVDRIRERNRRR